MAFKPEGNTNGVKYAGKDYFIPGYYLGYAGVVAAFVLPTLGALEAASTSLYYLQAGFNQFYAQYTTVAALITADTNGFVLNMVWAFAMG